MSQVLTLPQKRKRSARGGEEQVEIVVHLEVVTPILGGATAPRTVDEIDVIRVPTIRGHLRFWWRAMERQKHETSADLFAAESALWGRAADPKGGRSAVELTVAVEDKGDIDDDDIRLYPKGGQPATQGAYAVWPARAETRENKPTAPRRAPGTRFRLKATCPKAHASEVRAAIAAWILFGGYGGRTRRGLGSLAVDVAAEREAWLPKALTRAEFERVFGRDVLKADAAAAPADIPVLSGASLHGGLPVADPEAAWTTALAWLRDFRQKDGAGDGFAREPGADNRRPGRSNWPESDKVRQLAGSGPWAHKPRHNATPVWPRAGFGLPIIGQFQGRDRTGQPYRDNEPRPFTLVWKKGSAGHDRLASPLIVKAIPLADGRFVPAALWLNRGYPDGGKVGLQEGAPISGSGPALKRGSEAAFDDLVAPGDKPLSKWLAAGAGAPQGQRLRTAFCAWLAEVKQVKEVR
ncbi:MAG: CRISPR-associated protein Cmr1 [Candidatus Sericytochromatia bacterium]|nr:CRISPR-associated protein Cmr1 [Candidatus Tanganyikabacteria bacterium]